jgi:hypothetical protein
MPILAHGYLLVILLWSPCICKSWHNGVHNCLNTKLVELFANRVDKRRNMISDYLRGGACIESVRGSVDFEILF